MNYQQFIVAVKEKTTALLGETVTVRIQTVLKNNGTKRVGLMITKPTVNISPTIYLEQFFIQYQNGRRLSEIAKNIQSLYEEVKPEQSWQIEALLDFQSAQTKLAFKLIQHNQNVELLENIPHIPYLDLEIVFYVLLDDCEQGVATILITNDMVNHWGISTEMLYQVAMTNTPRILGAECKPMYEMVSELSGEEPEETDEQEGILYVLTNSLRYFGAACLLYPQVLEDIGNQIDDDYYLLPSSIHELIILPAQYALSAHELKEMITDINASQLMDEEVLSDHAYYYSRKENRVVAV